MRLRQGEDAGQNGRESENENDENDLKAKRPIQARGDGGVSRAQRGDKTQLVGGGQSRQADNNCNFDARRASSTPAIGTIFYLCAPLKILLAFATGRMWLFCSHLALIFQLLGYFPGYFVVKSVFWTDSSLEFHGEAVQGVRSNQIRRSML